MQELLYNVAGYIGVVNPYPPPIGRIPKWVSFRLSPVSDFASLLRLAALAVWVSLPFSECITSDLLFAALLRLLGFFTTFAFAYLLCFLASPLSFLSQLAVHLLSWLVVASF